MTYLHRQLDKSTGKWIYVAPDLTEFENYEDFEAYYIKKRDALVDELERIPYIETGSETLHMSHGDDDEIVWIIIPRTDQDIEIIQRIQVWSGNDGRLVTRDHINKPLAIRFGFDVDTLEVYDLERFKEEIARDIDIFITDIEEYDKKARRIQ